MIDAKSLAKALKRVGRRPELIALAAASDVPLSTLQKLQRGAIASPGLRNVNKLLPYLSLDVDAPSRKRKEAA